MLSVRQTRKWSLVILKFTTLILVIFFCFNIKADEVNVDVESTSNGYIIHADVPAGMTSTASFNNKTIKEALFRLALTELRGSEDWPAGANFSFFNKDKKSSFHMAFLIDEKVSQNIIIAIKIVENEKLVGADNFPIAVASLNEVAVRFKWESNKITMKFNSNEEVEIIPLSYEVDDLIFGLQSSKGTISVGLPNKAIK